MPATLHIPGPLTIEVDTPHGLATFTLPDALVTTEPEESDWAYPVGSEEFPTTMWYASQGHAWHKTHNPEGHTGIDLNGDKPPHGDVDRGQPIWAIADGVVHDRGYSEAWLGVVVLKHQHDGKPLYVRYAHLDPQTFQAEIGDQVKAADLQGKLGDYRGGDTGDHLHFDMCLTPFTWSEFKTQKRWIDPIPVLKAHLDDHVIDEMLKKQ